MRDWQKWIEQMRDQLRSPFTKNKPSAETDGNNEKISNINIDEKKRQKKILGFIIGGVGLIFFWVFFYPSTPTPHATNKNNKKSTETAFTSPIDNVDEQSVWLERAGNRLDTDEKNASSLQTLVTKQAQDVQSQQTTMNQQAQMISSLNQKYNDVLQKLNILSKSPNNGGQLLNGRLVAPANGAGSSNPQNMGMAVTTLALAPMPAPLMPPPAKTPENYVSAGSYVQAVLIGGLDASAGVTSQSEPRPVLLRTIDTGTLPNNFHSHLKNCRLIGAGYGDISSERAYIRLERMSCWKDGILVDYPVYGYVSGPDGKDGIRGKVVMRDGALVGRAFVGGLMSGLGQSISDNYTETSISPLGSTTSVKNGENLQYGAAQGVSNAADMYAQYNIKRAEQYQPVIEVDAGTVVDVVFNQGFYLDGQTDKQHQQQQPVQTSPLTAGRAMTGFPTVSPLAMNVAQLSNSNTTAAPTTLMTNSASPSTPQEFP